MDFQKNVLMNSSHLKYYALSLTSDEQDAKDLTQETIYKALKKENSYLTDKNLKSWLFTIMKNTFINQYRRDKYRRRILTEFGDLLVSRIQLNENEINIDLFVMRKDIDSALERLDEKYSFPFMLFYKGYKYKEIAEQLNLPLGTIKSRIYFARKILMEDLKGIL